jgi:hypothetical protein
MAMVDAILDNLHMQKTCGGNSIKQCLSDEKVAQLSLNT